jgi:mannan polymerase II complex MNN10 subunit
MVLAIVAIFIVVFQLMTNESTLLSGGSKSAPNDPRIAIVTFTTQEESYTHLSLKNKNRKLSVSQKSAKSDNCKVYARRHGYDLFVDWETIEPRGPYWYKFVMLEQVIAKEKYDWIWWIDFDTLITNTTVKLEDIIQESLENSTRPNDIDFLLNVDW